MLLSQDLTVIFEFLLHVFFQRKDETRMSLKLKPFDIIGSVQNVNNQMKSTPVLINLDDDNNAKSERKDGFYDSLKPLKCPPVQFFLVIPTCHGSF